MSDKPASGCVSPKTVGLLVIGSLGIGVAYSNLMINHKMSLPDALDAERGELRHSEIGRLNYYVDTSASGRPIVLIHSINAAASAYEMKPLFETYQGQRPVYALDLPGFGFSDRRDREYSPELYTKAIADFLKEVVGEPADLIALSLSSEFAAMVAVKAPERVNSLVMISPTGFNPVDIVVPEETVYRIVSFPLWRGPLFDLVASKPSIRLFLGRNFFGDPAEDMIDYAHRVSHQPGAKNAPLYFLSGKLFTTKVRSEVYAEAGQSVLVLYDKDPNVRFDKLKGFVSDHVNWQAVRITDTRGLPHWEQLDNTVAAIDEFWASV